jgi:hypothetical protein
MLVIIHSIVPNSRCKLGDTPVTLELFPNAIMLHCLIETTLVLNAKIDNCLHVGKVAGIVKALEDGRKGLGAVLFPFATTKDLGHMFFESWFRGTKTELDRVQVGTIWGNGLEHNIVPFARKRWGAELAVGCCTILENHNCFPRHCAWPPYCWTTLGIAASR